MLKKFFKGAIIASIAVFASCTEEIDKSNRYTFTEETLASYLENRPEFSNLIEIYKRADMMGTLGTYGEHTLFAPTNAAVERFLFEQDSIYHATKDTEEPIWTGITSPYLEDLSDSMAVVIAKTHLIPEKYETVDMTWQTMPTQNYCNRYISLNTTADENGYHMFIENKSEIIVADELVENGVVHVVNHVVEQTTKRIYEHVESYDYFSIFAKAIELTGYESSMLGYIDENYEKVYANIEAEVYRPQGTGYARHPKQKKEGYSIFAPYNEVLKAKYNINDIDDLIEYAQKWYGTEDADDYKSPKNALNRLVAYHLLDCEVVYDKFVPYKYNTSEFESEWAFMAGYDRSDYFVSKNDLILKVMRPLSKNDTKIYINPSRRTIPINQDMVSHMNVLVHNEDEFTELSEEYADFKAGALNGRIHPINGLLIYDKEEMENNVLYERMRFDFAALLPELMTNAVRYTTKKECGSTYVPPFGYGSGDVNIPDGYCKNVRINNDLTHLHYLTPYPWGATLYGDEFIASGQYDFEYRLPPVPAGTYEVRIGYTATEVRSITQFYMRKGSGNKAEICGIPVDLRIFSTDSRIGWIADSETSDNGVENDKTMRNHSYMKAPLTIAQNFSDADVKPSARHYNGGIRYIVTTTELSGYDNWLRMKNVMEDATKEGMHDYVELVPIGIVNDDVNLEDRE